MDLTARSPENLLRREPIFHHEDVISDGASFDAEIAPDFAEIGASGRQYDRATIRAIVLGRLAGTHPHSLVGGYQVRSPEAVALTADLVRVSYTLVEPDRVTRRSTFYRWSGTAWQAVFHQGTTVSYEGADRE